MTPRGALRETLSRIYHRLTGREAAALRYQRDAHAEEAGRERQRRMAAERVLDAVRRTRDEAIAHAERCWEERNIYVAPGNEYLRQKNEQHVLADARGQTIWRLQNRLARWQRRYRSAMEARDRWKKDALDTGVLLTERDIEIRELREQLATCRFIRDELRGDVAEQEGSRGGLAWMPGEAKEDP